MFEFKIEKQSPYLWVNLKGKLIVDDDASRMIEELSADLNEKNNIVIINLKELNYVNSSGFNNFLKLLLLNFMVPTLGYARQAYTVSELALCLYYKQYIKGWSQN